jgi:hypothetical protein
MMNMIERLKKLEAVATPGPWKCGIRKDASLWLSMGEFGITRHAQFDFAGFKDDAEFIALSRNALPKLLAVAEAARAKHIQTRMQVNPLFWSEEDIKLHAALAALEVEQDA